jgi:hypothetical protein
VVHEMRKAVSIWRKLLMYVSNFNTTGFKYVKHSDGRKFVVESTDIVAVKIIFLRTMCKIKKQHNITFIIKMRQGLMRTIYRNHAG